MLGIPDLGEIQAYLEELRTQAQRDRAARRVLRARSAVRSPLRGRLGRIVQALASLKGEAAGSEPPCGRFPVGPAEHRAALPRRRATA